MIRTLAAGTAVVLFTIGLVALLAGGDRVAGAAALAGLLAMAVALLVHVSEPGGR